jgi:hypothetical protein
LSGGAAENQRKLQAGYSVSGIQFEAGTLRKKKETAELTLEKKSTFEQHHCLA